MGWPSDPSVDRIFSFEDDADGVVGNHDRIDNGAQIGLPGRDVSRHQLLAHKPAKPVDGGGSISIGSALGAFRILQSTRRAIPCRFERGHPIFEGRIGAVDSAGLDRGIGPREALAGVCDLPGANLSGADPQRPGPIYAGFERHQDRRHPFGLQQLSTNASNTSFSMMERAILRLAQQAPLSCLWRPC